MAIERRTAVVTGASRGIGCAIAIEIARPGAAYPADAGETL